jgi:hypothetical protein
VIRLEGAERDAAPRALTSGKEQVLVEAKFFEVGAELPAALAVMPWMKDAPGNVLEVFAAEQAAGLAAVLGATKGIDLISAPSVTTRSGQQAVVEILREVRYPTDWRKDAQTGGWEPTKHGTKKVGTNLGVLAKVQNAEAIELTLRPEIVKLAGFQDLDAPGLPVTSIPISDAAQIVPAGRRAKAVFATRKMDTAMTVRAGDSVLVELGAPTFPEAAKRRVFVLAAVGIVKPEPAEAGDAKLDAADPAILAQSLEAQPKSAADSVQARAETIILPKMEFRDASVREAVAFLTAKSRELDPENKGVNIVLKLPETDTTQITLSLENVPLSEALRYLAELAGLKLEAGREAFVLQAQAVAVMAEPAEGTPAAQLLARARGIVIPKLAFKDATVAEGVEFLRRKSAELDLEKKAVNIVVMPSKSDVKATLDLANVSVAEALGYLAQLTGYRLEVTASAFVLRPSVGKE